ncbi:hypothetical protein [Alteromonas flava]|uniref:hypothetical protein n=1 Tax=Alteromonas flava TaxID=2048003 RepID=UPI000C28B63A|nr:hypothetical protein [Alteromonas flava]
MNTLFTGFKRTTIAISMGIMLSGCVIHVGADAHDWDSDDHEVSSVFGDVSVSAGKQVSEVSSVNGDVELHDRVEAERASSVNGDIEIGERVSVGSIDVVNGDIEAGEHFSNQHGIESVNGDIQIAAHGVINGMIKTVNGDIELNESAVNNDIITINGDIHLQRGTSVSGDIIYERNNSRQWDNDRPTLRIDADSTVGGNIVLHRPVKLEFADPQLHDKVIKHFGE